MSNRFTDKIRLNHTQCEKLVQIFKTNNYFIDEHALAVTPLNKILRNLDLEEALVIANTASVILYSEFYENNLPEHFSIWQKQGGSFSYNYS